MGVRKGEEWSERYRQEEGRGIEGEGGSDMKGEEKEVGREKG